MSLKPFSEGFNVSDLPRSDESAVESEAPLRREDKRKVWRSEELLGSESEAVIVHRGQEYRLRCTRQGKLILFK